MILASAAGVVVALMLLVAAVITSNLQLVYVAIGVSVAAALLLGIAVLGERLRARRVSSATATGATATGASGQTPEAAAEPAVVGAPLAGSVAVVEHDTVASAPAPEPPAPEPPAPDPPQARVAPPPEMRVAPTPDGDLVVLVVPGRHLFHRPGCVRLIGRLTEELTLDEAFEEGFSACTACEPGSEPDAADEPDTAQPGTAQLHTAQLHTAQPDTAATSTDAPDAPYEPGTPHAPDATEVPDEDLAGADLMTAIPPDATVHVVRGVSRFHTADCVLIRVVDEEDVDTMTLAQAQAAGCTPCRACHLD